MGLGVAGAQSWGSNTNSNGMIALTYNGTASSAADGLAAGNHGINVNASTYAFALGTLTLTINSANLLGTSGTVTYVAQETTQDTTKVKWWEPSTGNTPLTVAGTSTLNPDGSTTQGPAFTITYTAAVSNATLALSNLTTSGTIFAGGSLSASGSLTASGAAATNAKLSLAQVTGVTVTGSPATSSSLPVGTPLSLSATVSGTTAGSYALLYTGTSDNDNATAATGTLNLTVLEHASPTGTATVSIGSVLGGAPNVTATMTLGNASSDGNMTRGSLQVTGTTAGLSGAPIGTLLAAGSSTTLTAVINAASKSTAPGSFTVNVSDNQAYNGYQTQTDQTLTVTGTIGWASANSSTSYGTALTAAVNAGQALTGLFSQVDANHHGTGTAGTVAKILYSATLGTGTTVGMQWRQPTAAELTLAAHPLVSDVVDLTGMPAGTYVLQMSYDPTAPNLSGNDGALAAAGKLYLAYNNAGVWQNAIAGNTGFNSSMLSTASPQFHDGAWAGDTTLNDWGVDTSTDTVWAVLNHASEFAVVPEPATMAFLLLGGLAMSATALRRRSARK